MTIARKVSTTVSQVITQKAQRSTQRAIKQTGQAAAKVAADALATQTLKKTTRRAISQAATQVLLAPPVLTKKAAALAQAAGLSTVLSQKALTAGDLVFQQGLKKGMKQTEALKLASTHIGEVLADQKVSAELITALTNGLRPATRAQLGKAAAAGRVTRKVKEAVGKTTPAVKPVLPPVVSTPPAPKPITTKPVTVTPRPASPTKTPEAIRTLAADVTLLATATYEAGRATRRAANATYQAGQNARAFVARGGVAQGWQNAWARHDQAYQAVQREVLESAQNVGRKLKTLATRVIAQ